jgi:hypothetical protein
VIANLAKPSNLAQIAPGLSGWMEARGIDPSGYVTAVLYSLFFSLCPIMFKVSKSMVKATCEIIFFSYLFIGCCRQSQTLDRVPIPSLKPNMWLCNIIGGSWC